MRNDLANELSSNMVRTRIEGGGAFCLDANEIAAAQEPDPPVKPRPEGFDRIAAATLAIIKPCVHWTDEKGWIETFSKERYPIRELIGWMRVAFVFHQMTHGCTDAPEIQKDVFDVCVQAFTKGEIALETVQLSRISTPRAKACMEAMLRPDCEGFAEFWYGQLGERDRSVLIEWIERGKE